MDHIDDVLASTPVARIEDVATVLAEIEQALPVRDGVAWFGRLYLRVTEDVQAADRAGAFQDPGFLETLDVAFANRFFDALKASRSPGGCIPRAWLPLFDARARSDIAPIQFALAGMNAHINRDLPEALAQTFEKLAAPMQRPSVRADDYDRVNGILARVEQEVKVWFETGFVEVLDRSFGRVDDVLAIWSIETARHTAWTNGECLRQLACEPRIAADYLAGLDRMVGLAGRGLLLPV